MFGKVGVHGPGELAAHCGWVESYGMSRGGRQMAVESESDGHSSARCSGGIYSGISFRVGEGEGDGGYIQDIRDRNGNLEGSKGEEESRVSWLHIVGKRKARGLPEFTAREIKRVRHGELF